MDGGGGWAAKLREQALAAKAKAEKMAMQGAAAGRKAAEATKAKAAQLAEAAKARKRVERGRSMLPPDTALRRLRPRRPETGASGSNLALRWTHPQIYTNKTPSES